MKYRKKLFRTKKIYDLEKTDDIFVKVMKEGITFHSLNCPKYKELIDSQGFDLSEIKSIDDLHKLCPLPTTFLKNNTLLSKPYKKLLIKTTSSGTSGKKTLSGFDFGSALCGLRMVLRVFRFHKLISLRRTNYIILGYKPDKQNQTAMAKALKAFMLLAPKNRAVYALKRVNGEYSVQTEELVNAVRRFSLKRQPLRIIGFPAYFKMLLDELDERKISVRLHKKSMVMLGGGWKSFFAEELSKEELFSAANRILGIQRDNFKDHFSTAEHPINYVACENHHFHVPVYSRVIIRDVKSLKPLKTGEAGLLNLISPILSSAPFLSILTDDLAVLREGSECGCGLKSPYFELVGRVGLASIKTCTQTANDYFVSSKKGDEQK